MIRDKRIDEVLEPDEPVTELGPFYEYLDSLAWEILGQSDWTIGV